MHPTLELPFEEVINRLKCDLYYSGCKKVGTDSVGQPVMKYGVDRWTATTLSPKRGRAEGDTPMEAVENLLKSLDMY